MAASSWPKARSPLGSISGYQGLADGAADGGIGGLGVLAAGNPLQFFIVHHRQIFHDRLLTDYPFKADDYGAQQQQRKADGKLAGKGVSFQG